MTPRVIDAARAAETERAIVEAALGLVAEGGIEGLSMRQVATRVGLTAAALYRYFANKEALVKAVVATAFRRFEATLQAAAARHPRGSLERLHALGEAYVRFALEHEPYFRVLFVIQHEAPQALEDLPHGGGYALLRETIEEAMAYGHLRQANPDLMALYLWSVVQGIVSIALACRLEACPTCAQAAVDGSPVELYRAFRGFIREGISEPTPGLAFAPALERRGMER